MSIEKHNYAHAIIHEARSKENDLMEVNTMIEDEKKEEEKENKRPDLSKLERNIGWEGSVDGGTC